MAKARIMIQVEKEALAALKKLQVKTGCSVSESVRRAIAIYLKAVKP